MIHSATLLFLGTNEGTFWFKDKVWLGF